MDKKLIDITYFLSFCIESMLVEEKGYTVPDAIKQVYSSKLYQKLKIESTKTWHLGPVALYQELEEELRYEPAS